MIPTTWGGNLIPQGRRRLCRGQGEEILGRLGAARQRQRGPHLAVFLTLATHLRRPPEDVARDPVTQILGDHVAGARDDAVRHGDPSRPQPPDDLVRHFRCDREVRSLHPPGRLDFERVGGAHVPIGRDLVAQALDEGALRRRERIGHDEQVRPDTTATHDNPTMIGVEHQRGVDLRAVVPQLRGLGLGKLVLFVLALALDGPAARREPARRRELQGGFGRELPQRLYQPLPEGRRSNDHGAVVILQRAGDDLGCARRAPVGEHHHRKVRPRLWLRVAVRFGRSGRTAPGLHDLLSRVEEQLAHGHAQDVTHPVVEHHRDLDRADVDRGAGELEGERPLDPDPAHLELHRAAGLAAQLLHGLIVLPAFGRATEGWKNDQAVKQLRGEPGSAVELKVRRVGVEGPLAFKLTRATIHIRSVQVSMMLDDRVGYVLRVAVSELFLDPGQEVVETRGRAPTTSKTYRDAKPQPWPNLPVVVLTNGGTASAAEIITGALQDHDRAVVVGTPTFGKGLVQSLWQLTPETALKLTTARWFTPSGRTIQRKSKNEEDQLAQAEAAELGHDTTKVDSSLVFHTDHGRVVMGGGGIRPDLFVVPDTFTTAERAFIKGLGNKIPTYWDVRTAYALEVKTSSRVKTPDFTVTPEMADEIIRRLRARGVAVPDSVVAGARNVITQDLGYEIARYVFGRPAEVRRQREEDRQVRAALALARRAKSPQDLLALAAAQTPAPLRN